MVLRRGESTLRSAQVNNFSGLSVQDDPGRTWATIGGRRTHEVHARDGHAGA